MSGQILNATHIAINFDLSVKECKAVFGGSRSKAYRVLKKDMLEHGFVHDQGSGYVSEKQLSQVQIIRRLKGLFKRNEWLNQCCKKLRVTRIAEDIFSGEAHGDLMKTLDEITKSDKPERPIKKKIPKKKYDESKYEKITVGELAARRRQEKATHRAEKNGGKSPDGSGNRGSSSR